MEYFISLLEGGYQDVLLLWGNAVYCFGSSLIYWRISLIPAKCHWVFDRVVVGLPISRAVEVLFSGFFFLSSNLIWAWMISRIAILAFTLNGYHPALAVLYCLHELKYSRGNTNTFYAMCSSVLPIACPLSSIFLSRPASWSASPRRPLLSAGSALPCNINEEKPQWVWNSSCVSSHGNLCFVCYHIPE